MNSKGQKPSNKPLIDQKQDDEIEIVPIEKPKIAKKAKVEAMEEETLDVTPAIVEDGTQEAVAAKKKKVDTHPETNERKGRIFLKNLVFDTNEKMLRKLCVKFGEICDVNIPVDPSTNRPRGFAFVEYVNKNSALKAITDLNKIKWKGREIEVGLSVDKRRYLPNGQPAPGDGAAVQPITGEDLGGDIEVVKAGTNPSQTIADEKTKEEAAEDEEMDELDKIVMQNIEDMGDEFEFDSEDEDQADEDNKDKEVKTQPKQGVTEIDMGEVSKEDQSKSKKPEDLEKLLKDAENKKKKEIAKKQENEDLSKTCFVRGVSYDITEADFAKFIKQNIGDIHYVKLVAFKAAEGKHNGNGFVKFKDQKVADRLIDMTEQFNKGEYIPQAKDPKIEIHGIRVQFFPALKKNEAKEIKVEREKEIAQKGTKDEKKARTKKKFKSLDELIATDKTGKRRLVYTKLGFFDNIEDAKLNDVDKAQRSAHRDEKMAKIQNPNYFVSEKRVILKNIDKMLTDIQVRTLATEVMSAQLTPKEIKKSKIFSDVKLISSKTEESTGKSSGIAFIEFAKPEYAETFLKEISEHATARRFNHKRWPIIEFAFEDIRIASKIRNAAIRQQTKKAEGDKELEDKVDKVQQKEQKQRDKLLHENDKKYVKVKLGELVADPSLATKDKVTELIRLAKKNRGLKQRIKKKFSQFFTDEQGKPEGPQLTSQDIDQQKKKERTMLKKRLDPIRKEETKIMNKIKKKKALKQTMEESDKLDQLETEYSKKLITKAKWSNRA